MLLSRQLGYSFVRAVGTCKILERISGLGPLSESTDSKVFEMCHTSASILNAVSFLLRRNICCK